MTKPLATPLPPVKDEIPRAWKCALCGAVVGSDRAAHATHLADELIGHGLDGALVLRLVAALLEQRYLLIASGVTEELRSSPMSARVEKAVVAHPGTTADAVAERLGEGVAAVRASLARLRGRGAVASRGPRPLTWWPVSA